MALGCIVVHIGVAAVEGLGLRLAVDDLFCEWLMASGEGRRLREQVCHE